MCQTININNGEKHIETPREFIEFFGFEPFKAPYYNNLNLDGCLCQLDLETTFKTHNIAFYKDFDYYIQTKKP